MVRESAPTNLEFRVFKVHPRIGLVERDLLPLELFPSEFTSSMMRLPDRGVLAPFSYVGREYLLPVYDTAHPRVLMMFARQSEKTLQEDAPVINEYGERVPIKDVVVGDRVASMQTDGAHMGVRPVIWKSSRYRKRCVRVTTQLGHVVDLGYTHPVRQWGRWTIADQLKTGDRVATVRRIEEVPGTPMDPQHVAFVGYMLGDGGLGSSVSFTQDADSPALAHFRQICRDQGWDTREYKKKNSNSIDVRFNRTSSQAYGLLDGLGLLGLTSETKHVPPCMMQLPREQTIELLQAMWACGGHVKKKNRSGYALVYCSISQTMAQQVQSLLWKIGVPSRIRVQTPAAYRGTDKRAYLVHVRTREGIGRFLQALQIPGKAADLPDVAGNDNRDTLPIEAAQDLWDLYRQLGCSYGSTAHADGVPRMKLEYPPSRRRFQERLDYLTRKGAPTSELLPHNTTDLYWDVVVSVEDLGEQWCYDLEIEETNNFVAAGLVTHNSTTLGNKILALSALRHHFNSLVVTPSKQQTEVFSRDKLAAPLDLSDRLRTFLDSRYDNVLFKKFITGSSITLRYAFLHANRARGIPADALFLDEIQDLLTDVIPVLEECLTHSPYQLMHYSGTPKSLDNTLAYYWHTYSTMCEWMIPCDHCGGGDYRCWNTIGYENIGLTGLICSKCGGGLNKAHPHAEWVSQRSENWLRNPPVGIPFEGYRIPQPLTSWVSWDSVLDKKQRYSVAQFHNEVLALGYDSGEKLLVKEVLRELSVPSCRMANAHGYRSQTTFYMGIDWGGGGGAPEGATRSVRSVSTPSSHTVVSIGGYMGGRFQYVYFKRFEGPEAHIDTLIPLIIELVRQFNVARVGTDYGGGLDKNDMLIRNLGIRRVARYQYVNTRMIHFNHDLHHWMVNRSEALMALINAVNRKNEILFPNWEDWEFPYAEDLLAVFREYNLGGTMTITKTPGTSDDTLHSCLYSLLASMIDHPRPDILAADLAR